MKLLGNIIWLFFGGLIIAIEYFVASIVLFITIIGIPFGIQALKLGMLALWPFGHDFKKRKVDTGCLYTLMNIIWLFTGGLIISLTHVALAFILAITIVGLPWAGQHLKLAGLALSPFGRDVV